MNPDLEHLIVLQAQDLELSRLRTEVAEAPRRVASAESVLRDAEKALGAVRASVAAEEKLRRGQESDIATQRSKIKRLRQSLDSAVSAAQVAAFEKEIGFAEGAVARLEDEEFASLERTETLEVDLVKADATEAQRRKELEAQRIRSSEIVAGNGERIRGVEQQRKELRAEIREEWLTLYDRLSKAKGTAVAEALGTAAQGKCSACQMTVRPQRWRDLTGRDHDDTVFTCESCGRMLFWDPRRDTPKAWEVGDRLRRAQDGGAR
ncbi:MAG: hypothetical protein INR62_07375 [Rhodospirillales bacterium]|nr:hypothetical protein [Acetobacter sp.]